VGGCCGDFERAGAEFGFWVVHGCVALALVGRLELWSWLC
jgi:hypothetical protein